jgi:hypothetical protein
MAISTFKRYEKKFLLTQLQYKELIIQLKNFMEPDAFCKEGNSYCINNIYYDTWDNQVIRNSLSKPYYKEKLRLRSYGTPAGANTKVYLELKKKIGGIVNKRRAEMTLQAAIAFLNTGIREKTNNYMNEQVLDEISFFLKNNPVEPAVYIGYERIAYFGKEDRDFRITFDQNIMTRRNALSLTEDAYGQQLLENGQYLMEVKIEGAFPIWLTRILADLKIYSTSFSKYGNEYKYHVFEENTLRKII